jgi:hypothetical protein
MLQDSKANIPTELVGNLAYLARDKENKYPIKFRSYCTWDKNSDFDLYNILNILFADK